MDFWYPDDDAPIDPNWWAPLMRFGLAAARDGLPALDPEEFMFMGRVVRKVPNTVIEEWQRATPSTPDLRGYPRPSTASPVEPVI